jgi:hypothetical protein
MMTDYKLVEPRYADTYAEYTERWVCDPPAEGVSYRVLDEEWNDDVTTRTIYRIELA